MNKLTTEERFAKLFQKIEQSPRYQVEGLKIEITEQIYLAMRNAGINNAELARRLGKSRAYVTKVLSGNVNFTLETLVVIAEVLSCEINFAIAPKQSVKNWEALAIRQPQARRLNWRDQNYLRLVVNNDQPNRPREVENHVPVPIAA